VPQAVPKTVTKQPVPRVQSQEAATKDVPQAVMKTAARHPAHPVALNTVEKHAATRGLSKLGKKLHAHAMLLEEGARARVTPLLVHDFQRKRARQHHQHRLHRPRQMALLQRKQAPKAAALLQRKEAPKAEVAETDEDDDSDDDDEGAGGDEAEGVEKPKESKQVFLAKQEAAMIESDIDILKRKLRAFTNKRAFNAKIAADVKTVANETASPGLARFMGDIAKEVRTLGAPDYIDFLEDEIEDLEKKKKEQMVKIEQLSKQEAQLSKGEAEKKEGKGEGKDKEKKGDDEEGDDEAEAREPSNSGQIFAASMMGTMMLFSVAFAMANSPNPSIKDNTLFLVDQVVAIFIAVVWYQAIDSCLDASGIAGQHKFIFSIIFSVVMLLGTILVAFKFKSRPVTLAVLCGCMAHFVSFASMHMAGTAQQHVTLQIQYSPIMCAIGILCLVGFFALLGGLIWFIKRAMKANSDEEFMDKTDDLENDFFAMATAFCFSMLVRFILTGHHPKGEEVEYDHTAMERFAMLIYSVISLVVAAAGVILLQKVKSERYFVKRAVMFLNAFLPMNVAWAWLLWGEWEFFETQYKGDEIFGMLCFALVVTLAVSILTILLAFLPKSQGGGSSKCPEQVCLVALGLLVAWSWESVFDQAIEEFTEGRSHPAPYRLAAALILSAAIVPVFVIHLKPITMPAIEALESGK